MARATLDHTTSNSRLELEIERPWFRHLITVLIIVNAVVLGILTYRQDLRAAWWRGWKSSTTRSHGYSRWKSC